ncbi:hypothetical protein BT69DRAFT_1353237 [Atractiella rhizophila]|nr:hypothetical protein BT69DRAFT_1353237 [Atractiella rhizophila]
MTSYNYAQGGPGPKMTPFMKQLQQQNDSYATAYQTQPHGQAQYQNPTQYQTTQAGYSQNGFQQQQPSTSNGYYAQQAPQYPQSQPSGPYYSQQQPSQYPSSPSTYGYQQHHQGYPPQSPQTQGGWRGSQSYGQQPAQQPQYQQPQPQQPPTQHPQAYQPSSQQQQYQYSTQPTQHYPPSTTAQYPSSHSHHSQGYASPTPVTSSYANPTTAPASYTPPLSSPNSSQPPPVNPATKPVRRQDSLASVTSGRVATPPTIPSTATKPIAPRRSDSVSSVGSIKRPLPMPPPKPRDLSLQESVDETGPVKRFKPKIGWGGTAPAPSVEIEPPTTSPPATSVQGAKPTTPVRVQRVFDPPSSQEIGGVKVDEEGVEAIRKRMEELVGPSNDRQPPAIKPKPPAVYIEEPASPPSIQTPDSPPSIAVHDEEQDNYADGEVSVPVPTFSFDGGDEEEEDQASASIAIAVAPPSPKPQPSQVDSYFTHAPRDPSEKNLPTYIPTIIPRSRARGPPSEEENMQCAECGQLIIGRMVSALRGKKFHPDCFTCVYCGTNLEHIAFFEGPKDLNGTMKDVEEGAEIGGWCGVDWDEHFSLKCYHCKTAIVDESYITISEPSLGPPRTYHELHFFCANCGDPFIDPKSLLEKSRISQIPGVREENGGERKVEAKPFVVRKGHPYCQRCNVNLYRPKCGGCGKGIEEDTVVKALDKSWHEDCFVCHMCRKPFPTSSFFTRDDGPKNGGKKAYHEDCYKIRLRSEM